LFGRDDAAVEHHSRERRHGVDERRTANAPRYHVDASRFECIAAELGEDRT
jgi:hypothetical protein